MKGEEIIVSSFRYFYEYFHVLFVLEKFIFYLYRGIYIEDIDGNYWVELSLFNEYRFYVWFVPEDTDFRKIIDVSDEKPEMGTKGF